MQTELLSALQHAVASTGNPGAVAYVGNGSETFFHRAFGMRQVEPEMKPAEPDTIYDLASLTKVVATATAALKLWEARELDIDRPVSAYLPAPAFREFTPRHLLTHTAGLVAGRPYYKDAASMAAMLQLYAERGIDALPGRRRLYSDVGFMILGRVVELVAQDRLDAFCREAIFAPLGMETTGFNPPPSWRERCAATERCAWRERVIVGEVHDENAYAVGGISGHAGLFATAPDLARFCRGLLAGTVLKESTVAAMTALSQVPFHPWQGLGWQLDPWASTAMGYLPSRTAFGHTGWTGTSMWLDRGTGLFVLLLGNTCHPTRTNRKNRAFRGIFHDAVAKQFYPGQTNTHTGLDRLLRDRFEPLRGKRVALLTHHAAVDQLGRHILDVFGFAEDVELTYLYSPEHGIRGQAEAGETVASQRGPVPVISLYGERKEPSAAELETVDVFVVDLQDVGARYYTYPETMRRCIDACRRADTPVLVLDRPNPVGGAVLEGPVAEAGGSPVRWGEVPARHGMTLGEMAVWFAGRKGGGPRLAVQVSALDNWPRERLFAECALPWVPPSPNLPTPAAALLYTGTCLFEGVNVNEGRGTDMPFEVAGAPWVDPEAVIGRVPASCAAGCTLEPVSYTPRSIPGKASAPRYLDEVCRGVRIRVEYPHAARPFSLAVALVAALRAEHPGAFAFEPPGWFDLLAGTKSLREAIERGDSCETIVARDEADHARFRETAPKRYD